MAKAISRNRQQHPTTFQGKTAYADLTQKKEKGRSRNACDRCKQKKVRCDGEGTRVCTICRDGDHHCVYAQKPHEEKRKYRKGYVEMVEEANAFYRSGIHKLWQLCSDHPVFADLCERHGSQVPTAQEILSAAGHQITDQPFEGGIESIEAHLARENKPMMVREGEWDHVNGQGSRREAQRHGSVVTSNSDRSIHDADAAPPAISALPASEEAMAVAMNGYPQSSPELGPSPSTPRSMTMDEFANYGGAMADFNPLQDTFQQSFQPAHMDFSQSFFMPIEAMGPMAQYPAPMAFHMPFSS